MFSRNDLEKGVRELARFEYWSGGSDQEEEWERSCDSIRASLREEVMGDAPAIY